jgi:hypothetical protein
MIEEKGMEDYDGNDLFEEIPDWIAYFLLGLLVFLDSIIIPLYISIPEITVLLVYDNNKWARNSWRFLF